jgi:DNA repair exonuclease SbcCD nuclease subunit
MKIALINDTHFGVKNDSPLFLDHQQRFFEEIFFPYLDEHNIKTVLDLGDTFDRRKYINFVTLNRAKQFFFEPMKSRGIDYHAVVGNHSVYYKNTNEINSMSLLLQEYENVSVYVHEPKELTFGSTRFIMVPWINRENQELCYRTLQTTSADIVLGHFEIAGFEMMRGMRCDHGMDKDIFSRFEAVYSGHFHHPSEYGNIRYLGAQYEMTWTDYAGRRGFSVIDTDTRDLEFVENPNRIHHRIEYDDTDMAVDDIAHLDTSMLRNTFIKIIVKNRTNPYLFDLFVNKMVDSGAADVKTVEDTLNLESSGMEELLSEAKDTKDILHSYIDGIETRIEKTRIKKVVDDLYIEALSL